MQPIILIVLVITVINAIVFHRGRLRNRKLIVDTCETMERVFHPTRTLYTNIGGVVGYNLHYDLDSPFISLEGVVTTAPRQALFYRPITRLTGRSDSLIFSVTMESLPPGEAHIVASLPFRLGRIQLDDADEFRQTMVHNKQHAILSYNDIQESRMLDLFDAIRDPAPLVHLGYFGKTRCFSIVVDPDAVAIEAILVEIREALLVYHGRYV